MQCRHNIAPGNSINELNMHGSNVEDDTWGVGCDRRQQHGCGADGLDVIQPVEHPEQLALPVFRL